MEEKQSLSKSIEDYIRQRGEPVAVKEVVAHFSGQKAQTVRVALHRLEQGGRLVSPERGMYQFGDPEGLTKDVVVGRVRRKTMTLDEYTRNREDLTMLGIIESADGFEIILRLDGSYSSLEIATEQARFVSKTLGIPLAGE